MRIGIISMFLLAASVPVFSVTPAKSQGIEQVAVNITLKNESLVKAFHKIESQSPFHFMYRNEDVKDIRNLEITASNQSVAVFLKTILSNTSLKFRQVDNQILITKSNTDKIAGDGKTDAVNDDIVASKGIIKGTVVDSKGSPLVGVTVKLGGAASLNKGTDINGGYSFANLPAGNYSLTFTFIGYKSVTKTVALGEDQQTVVDAILTESTNSLDEVVVTGYGTQKKREVTSAITSVNAAEFNKGNISDVAQLLQGKVAGLSISRPGGDPNGGFAIRLRGLSTLGANTQPLIVLDGQVGADINTVDPNDIKSIDVLKDGSAAAIYGTRGSAGVIIITTIAGKRGASKFTYNVSGTAETPAKFTQHMNAAQFKALGKGTDYGSSTDWDKEITRTALSHVHNLGISGGDERTVYDATFNYRNSEGVAITTGFQQLNGRLNITHKALDNKLVLNLNINTTNRNSQFGFPDAFKYATIFNPTAPVYSKDPLYDLTGGGFFESNFVDYSNPVAMLLQNTNEARNKKFNMGGTATYEITTGLKISTKYFKQTTSIYHSEYSPTTAFISRGFPLGSGFGRSGISAKYDDESENSLSETTLSYEKTIKKLEISAVAGYSYQDFFYQGFDAQGGNFVTDASGQNFAAALDFKNGIGVVESYKNENKLISFFGRVNLNYDNIAFLSASLRRDGSTEFGTNNKWGFFPAVSAGLDLSRIFEIPGVSNLKLRGSYGVTGALPPLPYLSLSTLSNSGGTYYGGNGVYLSTYSGTRNPNPGLKWEKKAETDIGLDFSLLKGRLTGTFDYFNRKTTDLIFDVTVPSPPALFNNTWENIGELNNSGVELALSYEAIKTSNFSWTTGGNISSYHVVLTKLVDALKGSYVGATNLGTPGQEATQLTRAVEGQPIGLLYGPKYVGVDANGVYQYSDGKGGTVGLANAPRQVIGNGLPKFEFGISNAFKYKQFDFNFFLRSSIGHQLINTYRAFYENPNVATSYNIVNTKFFNPKVTDGAAYSSYDVEKASFLKLDNATLGYTFKVGKSSKPGMISSLRAYISGQNLFTITNYTGVDPEVRYTDGFPPNPLAPGIDRRETWVYTRSFTLGVNIGF